MADSINIPVQGAEVSVQIRGTYESLPGVQSHSEGGGDLNSETIQTFKDSLASTDLPEVAPVTITSLYNPVHPAWRFVRDAAIKGTLVNVQFTTAQAEFFDNNSASGVTAAIAGTGIVTLVGSPDIPFDDVGRGAVLIIDGKAYVIDELQDDGKGATPWVVERGSGGTGIIQYSADGSRSTLAPPTSVAADADFKVVTPKLRVRYAARFGKPGADAPDGGNLQTSFTVQPTSHINDWVVEISS